MVNIDKKIGNTDNIQSLRNVIYDNLDPLITGDYCLLDVPDHKNIGDNLIWAGELAYLSRLPYKMKYTSNLYLFEEKKIDKGDTILLHGGGNFGDVWRTVQKFRNNIIKNFKENKIIVFPQTVQYYDSELLNKDIELYSQHPDLTICARDTISYDLLKENFANVNVLLVPDMAFCLDLTSYHSNIKTNKRLFLKRNDKELNSNTDQLFETLSIDNDNFEVKDWPTFNISSTQSWFEHKAYSLQRRLAGVMLKTPVLKSMVDPRYGLYRNHSWENYLEVGISFINEYDEIYSTRLHTYILAILLNKRVFLLDNSYGKNSRIFNTWMKDFEHSYLVK